MAIAGSVDPTERSSRDLWVMRQPVASGCESSPFKKHGQQVARFEPSGLVVGVCGRYWLRADKRADVEALLRMGALVCHRSITGQVGTSASET